MLQELPQQNLQIATIINGFRLDRIQPLPEIQASGYLFHHLKSGANCIHLFNNDPDNLFSIAFRTPVYDNTGVPHILEHSVLCGSKRYPVKDPFQEMLKGSLQTFLNALTYPDKTVYPVSSQVEKDYFNLAMIYADAVFNPLLSENTFYQEGWHFDVTDAKKPAGIKGIVYNEMKGVFSNFSSHVNRRTISALFPDTTYYFESGGDPEHITDLTYRQFTDFHRRYYHPSNSYIVLYGNIPSKKTLAFLDDHFLSSFTAIDITSAIAPQPLWSTPRSLSFEAPSPPEDRGTATVVIAWIFGETTDPIITLAGKIISHYLLEGESSPLKRALIDSGLGEDLADLSGFDADLRQLVFTAGLRKTKPEHSSAIEKVILDTLEKVVVTGPDFELLEGALRQVEFGLREITGGHFPYNLRMADRCYRSWIYDGDPFGHLAFEEPLTILRMHIEKRDTWFSDTIRKRLLHNSHRLRSTVTASPEMGERLEKQTLEQTQRLTAAFTDADMEHYAALTQSLITSQATPSRKEDLVKLPTLSVADLPHCERPVDTTETILHQTSIHRHRQFTSGIVYIDLGFDIRSVAQTLLPYIPLYCEYVTRSGAAGLSFEQMATRIARTSGGIDASVHCKTITGTMDDIVFRLFFHAKSLTPRFDETLDIVHALFTAPDLNHAKLLRDILLEERNTLTTAVVGSGHKFALANAAAKLTKARALDEMLGGITQLRFLDSLVRQNDAGAILEKLRQLHDIIINRQNALVILTADDPDPLITPVHHFVESIPEKQLGHPATFTSLESSRSPCGIEINSAVNFIGKVWMLSPVEAESAGRLLLLSRILSAGYLWDKVRVEGGAYGGMSSVSVAHPVFSCASYRDPNLLSTINHFTKGLETVALGLPQAVVNHNIIGTIGHIDSPLSPHARCFNESLSLLIGADSSFRQKMRDSVLSATSDDLKEVAAKLLSVTDTSTTILGSAAAFDLALQDGFTCGREALLGTLSSFPPF